MGFVTRGRGVTVHRTDCANAVSLSADQPDRLIDVEWDQQSVASFIATVEVKALDRPLLLRDIVNVLADHQINVVGTSTVTSETDRVARLKFEFELGDPAHLDPLIRILRNIDSVYDVYRVVPGQTTNS
jgi:GTP pyrophosphokinase